MPRVGDPGDPRLCDTHHACLRAAMVAAAGYHPRNLSRRRRCARAHLISAAECVLLGSAPAHAGTTLRIVYHAMVAPQRICRERYRRCFWRLIHTTGHASFQLYAILQVMPTKRRRESGTAYVVRRWLHTDESYH